MNCHGLVTYNRPVRAVRYESRSFWLIATAVQPLTAAVPVPNATGSYVVVVIGSDLAGSGFPATTAPTGSAPTTTVPAGSPTT